MKGAPWFKFWVADFRGGTLEFSNQEVGAFLRLLLAQWERGSLPSDPDSLSMLACGPVSARVLGKFKSVEEGRIKNARMEQERDNAAEKSLKAAEAGRIGGLRSSERYGKRSSECSSTDTSERSTEDRGQRTEDRIQSSEARSQKNVSCAESGVPAPAPDASPVVLTFPCNGKKGDTFPLRQSQVDEWGPVYPGIDVLAECRKAHAWENANPAKRKTKKGKMKFLNSWLSRSQDRAQTMGGVSTRQVTIEEANRLALQNANFGPAHES